MMKRMARVMLVMGAVLGGCRSTAEVNAIAAKARTLMTSPEYIIGEGDTVTIRVLDFDQYQITTPVRPDGKVSFPQHGDIVASGKTAPQLRKELEHSFQKSLGFNEPPKVFVSVNTFASKSVTIFGQVIRPGRVPYQGQMRVSDLLGFAVGCQLSAAPNRTVLFREVDGATKIYQVKLKDFFFDGDFSTNFFLRPGDIVYVPRNGFAKVAAGLTVGLAPINAIAAAVGLGANTTNLFISNRTGN